jgi:uncharacterized protein with FMN-binding domain
MPPPLLSSRQAKTDIDRGETETMNVTTKKRLLIPLAAAATLASTGLAACGGQATTASTAATNASTASVASAATVAASSATSAASTASATAYKDGTYTGDSVAIRWGDVQVKVVVSGGQITDVSFLSYPTDQRSQAINSQAAPALAQEAVSAQSASVQVVSGATFTSRAFMQSLASALSQA